tara:strand:+ start:379 stop:774 length:396 start_codon:yes stop_codon:yes gene_type:complete
MSEIKTNKLTGTSTAGSILVTGEGNSTTTNLQQGLAKAWCSVDVTTVDDSFNISSLTDTATGKATMNYSNNMASEHYGLTMNCAIQSQVPICYPQDSSFITTSAHRIVTEIEASSLADAEYLGSQVTGDLA